MLFGVFNQSFTVGKLRLCPGLHATKRKVRTTENLVFNGSTKHYLAVQNICVITFPFFLYANKKIFKMGSFENWIIIYLFIGF